MAWIWDRKIRYEPNPSDLSAPHQHRPGYCSKPAVKHATARLMSATSST